MKVHRFLAWTALLVLFIVSGCRPATDLTPVVPTPAQQDDEADQEQPPPAATATSTEGATSVTAEPTPTPTPTAEASANGEELPVVEAARADLRQRLEGERESVEIISLEEVEWPDTSLGCPLPGAEYEKKTTTGYIMVMEVNGERYEYHSDQGARLVLCNEDGQPLLPTFPARPGAIDDGQPWMPVDPVPNE